MSELARDIKDYSAIYGGAAILCLKESVEWLGNKLIGDPLDARTDVFLEDLE